MGDRLTEMKTRMLLPMVLAACGGGDPAPRAPVPSRPDVVLMVVDTLRADRLGCYGYERPTSPVIDGLAAEGALFLGARAQCSWTLPSMASLMTGTYLTNPRDVYPEGAVPLAERFRNAGYRTIGMVGNVIVSERMGYGEGFERYDANGSSDVDRPRVGLCRTMDALLAALEPLLDSALAPDRDGQRAPLFLYIHPMDPHSPYLEHPEFEEELPLIKGIDPEELAWQRRHYAERGASAPEGDPNWEGAWREVARTRGLYDREVRFTDQQFGRLLDELRSRGVLAHAVVVVAADHGEGLCDNLAPQPPQEWRTRPPKHFFHSEHDVFLWENLVRTPLILWGAGVPAGARIDTPVENVDIYPTLLELCGLDAVAAADGRSVVPFLLGAGAPKEFYFARVRQHVSAYEAASGLKLILPTGDGVTMGEFRIDTEPELFDLRADPQERHNLLAARPADVARLKAAIAEWVLAHPTEIHLQRERDPQTIRDLQALGYLGKDE